MDIEAEEQLALEREKVTLQRELELKKLDLQRELEGRKIDLQRKLETDKLIFERRKATLDYKKFVLGSVFVALAIAAIPPLFQLATAALEYVKSNADRLAKQQAFRDEYNKEFISNALNQDIELRIRFAQYLASVSTEPYRQDWSNYHDGLKKSRDTIRSDIDKMEARWRALSAAKDRDEIEIAHLERNLDWAYKEVGYVVRNRSVVANPRAPEATNTAAPVSTPLVLQSFLDKTYFLTKPLVWSPKTETGKQFEAVIVPAGFVTSLDSLPPIFWGTMPDMGVASVIHDYLYWDQSKPREVADTILKVVLEENGASPTTVAAVFQAVRSFGQKAWDENAKRKAQGEKRVIKFFPTAPTKWEDWKKRADVFE